MRKKVLLLLLMSSFTFINAGVKEDPTVMTIAGKEIPLSEFIYISKKDKEVDLSDMKSLKNYVELFKTFKLKVADAEAEGLDQTNAFKNEYNSYIEQLKVSFLSDQKGEERVLQETYNRGKHLLNLSHIAVNFPSNAVGKDTVEAYRKIQEIYGQIKGGASFEEVGQQLAAQGEEGEYYVGSIPYLAPLETRKAIENAAYRLAEGEISQPIRSDLGYHILRLNKKIVDPGMVKVAHILFASFEQDEVIPDSTLLKQAEEISQKIKDGEEFSLLAQEHSADVMTGQHGGSMPYFGLGQMVLPFEQASFALTTVGEISKPVKTRYGYHLIKLLGKLERPSFHELERELHTSMKQGEWNFELFDAFDQREKKKFNYRLNQEAYNELLQLCNDYFPTDSMFYKQASKLNKTLMWMNDEEFDQKEFAEYIRVYPFSVKNFSADFLEEVYRLFVRDIYTSIERETLEVNNPEYPFLMKEYRDGILLFNISSQKVWDHPLEEQDQLENAWMKSLLKKYPTKVNWSVLKKLNKKLKTDHLTVQ